MFCTVIVQIFASRGFEPCVRQTNYKTKIAFLCSYWHNWSTYIWSTNWSTIYIYYAILRQLRFREGVLYGQDSLSASRGPFWDRLSTPITLQTGGWGNAVARSCGQILILLVQLSVVKGGCKEIRIDRLRQPAAQASRHLCLVQQRLLYFSAVAS